MSEQTPAQYIAVDIKSFRSALRDICFDVYLKLSEENYAHIFSKTTGLDYKRLAQYAQKGVTELYIRAEDELLHKAFVGTTAESVLMDPNVASERKIATLLNMTEQNMAEVFSQLSVSEETVQSTERVMKNYVSLLAEDPKSLSIMLKLVAHGEYLYYHSVAVSIFSIFLAKATGLFNQNMLELVGMGGFLHDIGCTKLSKDVFMATGELSPAQWKEMRCHTKYGLQMIESTPNIPDEVKYVIYQHHEEHSGTGYPNGLRGSAIYYPSKIVALADGFSALISERPYRPAYTAEQAIHILQSETGRYERELVTILSSIFLRQYNQKAS